MNDFISIQIMAFFFVDDSLKKERFVIKNKI